MFEYVAGVTAADAAAARFRAIQITRIKRKSAATDPTTIPTMAPVDRPVCVTTLDELIGMVLQTYYYLVFYFRML